MEGDYDSMFLLEMNMLCSLRLPPWVCQDAKCVVVKHHSSIVLWALGISEVVWGGGYYKYRGLSQQSSPGSTCSRATVQMEEAGRFSSQAITRGMSLEAWADIKPWSSAGKRHPQEIQHLRFHTQIAGKTSTQAPPFTEGFFAITIMKGWLFHK